MQETQEMQVWSLGWEDPLEEEVATNSSILAWKIPWTEEPGQLHVAAKKQMQLSTHNVSRITLAVYLIKLKK